MMRNLVIRQLEGARRVLTISGELVLPGFSWPMRQRGGVREYDGSEIGSAHLKGGSLGETTLRLRIWTQQIARGGMVTVEGFGDFVDADDVVRLLKQMCSEPVLVGVTWGPERQVGFLAEVDPPYGRPGEFSEISVEIQWVKRDQPETAPKPRPERNLSAAIGQIGEAWRRGIQGARKPASVARKALTVAEAAVAEVNGGIRQVASLAGEYRAGVRDVRAIRTGSVGGLRQIVTGAANLRAAVGGAAGALVQSDDAAEVITGRAFLADVDRAATQARGSAEIARRRQAIAERSDLRGVYTAKDGDDLRLIAFRFYDDFEAWTEIARFNGFTGSLLTAGQTVLLPDIRAGV